MINYYEQVLRYKTTIKTAAEMLEQGIISEKEFAEFEQEIAEKYGIDTIPTLLLFKNGEVAGTIVAPDSKAKIETFIQEYL